MKVLAYAWRSGQIGFGEKLPAGALSLARDEESKLRETVAGLARHAWDGKTLLVPGVPEQADDSKALEAHVAFQMRVIEALKA